MIAILLGEIVGRNFDEAEGTGPIRALVQFGGDS
jgi:hypothetical protein